MPQRSRSHQPARVPPANRLTRARRRFFTHLSSGFRHDDFLDDANHSIDGDKFEHTSSIHNIAASLSTIDLANANCRRSHRPANLSFRPDTK
jgi:hypothetical protein